ncbi:MAG: TolC family protein, partial [Candidatus Hinthialibacter sp.]
LFSKGIRGYWIPGDGVVFMLGVKFPLIQPEEVESTKDPKPEKDLWDKFEERLSQEGAPNPLLHDSFDNEHIVMKTKSFGFTQSRSEFYAQKIEPMRETILDALAKYGHRIEGFEEDETITVIVEGQSELSLGRAPISTGASWSGPNVPPSPPSVNVFSAPGASSPFSDSDNQSKQQEQKSMMDPMDSFKKMSPPQSQVRGGTPGMIGTNQKNGQSTREKHAKDSENQVRQLENERDALIEILKTRESDFEAAERELELSKQKMESANQSFKSGRTDQMKMHDSEKQMLDAQKSLNEARRQLVDLKQKMRELQLNLEIAKKNKETPRQKEAFYGVAIPDAGRISEPVIPNLFFSGKEEPAVMVMQIRFGDLPQEEGAAEDIRDQVRITVY